MRVRKVVTRRGRHIRGYFPSIKMGRMVAWESLLERDAILLLELSPGISTYQEQPEEISYWNGDAMRCYIPDFLATTISDENWLLEIKPAAKLDNPDIRKKYTRISEDLLRKNKNFRILTELEIRAEPRFSNLKTLLYYYTHPLEALPTSAKISALFEHGKTVELNNCICHFGMTVTYCLIAKGQLSLDFSQPITAASLVSLPKGGTHAAIYF